MNNVNLSSLHNVGLQIYSLWQQLKKQIIVKTTDDLMQLAGMGTNLVVDASTKKTADLILIAGSIGLKGGHLRIVNCSKKPAADLI